MLAHDPTSPFALTGARVLVTGASSGIGRAVCLRVASMGATVLLVGRDLARLEDAATAMDGEGHQVLCRDLADHSDLPAWLRDVALQYGPMAALVHCAGQELVVPLRSISTAVMDRVWDVNVTAALHLAQGFRQRGVHVRPGSIVLASSVLATRGAAGSTVYSASKAAIEGLTRSLAVELAPQGIRVNCVAPGYVRTPMLDRVAESAGRNWIDSVASRHPLGLGEPDYVANAIAFLVCGASAWMTGTTVTVDGGYSVQ